MRFSKKPKEFEIDKILKRCKEDVDYFRDNYESIRRMHPDMHVAIYEKRVVYANRDRDKLRDFLVNHPTIPINFTYITRTFLMEAPESMENPLTGTRVPSYGYTQPSLDPSLN